MVRTGKLTATPSLLTPPPSSRLVPPELTRLYPMAAASGVALRPVGPDDPRPGLCASPGAVAVAATRSWRAGEVVGPYVAWVTSAPEFDATVALLDRKDFEAFAVTTTGAVDAASVASDAAAAGVAPEPEPLVFCAFPPECAGVLAQLNDWRPHPPGTSGTGASAAEEEQVAAAAGAGDPCAHKRRRGAGEAMVEDEAVTASGEGGGDGIPGTGPNCQLVRNACSRHFNDLKHHLSSPPPSITAGPYSCFLVWFDTRCAPAG